MNSVGKLEVQTHTQNTYCFSAATVVTRTHLSITLCVHCECTRASADRRRGLYI